MLNYIWFFMVIAGIFYAGFSGTLPEMSEAVMSGAKEAVELSIFLLGSMCAWLGFLRIAEESGLTAKMAKLLSPVVDRLFPEYKTSQEIKGKICMNLIANFLGIGNAATPLGLSAMKAMEERNRTDRPTKGMILFVILNTASIQLLPLNMAAIRQNFNSVAPFGILPQIWITSMAALLVCILCCKGAERSNIWKR
jgi:Uncharacterized membrane protein, required for spore maturation in B.subtilis.